MKKNKRNTCKLKYTYLWEKGQCMTTKLTLSIDKQTIDRAKLLSSITGKSISKMVEEYLNTIAEKSGINGSATDRLSGILKDKMPADLDWKQVKADYLKKKYAL